MTSSSGGGFFSASAGAAARSVQDGTAPGCPHADVCPGCAWITRPYAAGLDAKREKIERALSRYPELGAGHAPEVLPAEQVTAYRVRAKLVASEDGRLGLYGAGGHQVLDLPGCRVLAPELAEVAAQLRELLPLPMSVAAIDLRSCDRGVLVCLVVEGARPPPEVLEQCSARVREGVPRLAGLAVSYRKAGSVQLLGQQQEVLSGEAAEAHHLSPGAPFHYASHGAFTQVHAAQATRMHEAIERALAERLGELGGRRVLDLYAGSGALALRLAARGAEVLAIESFEPAARRIESAAQAQSLRLEARAMEAEAFLQLEKAAPFDAVIVNPPRRGLAPSVRAGLARLAPKLVVYVSCEPETFTRDLSQLALLGLGRGELGAIDMIPLSDAVECLALLEPQRPPAPRVLYEDADSLALFKLPFEPTSPGGEGMSSLLERARAGLGLPALTPVHRLDAETSGICWFARRPERAAELEAALGRGEKMYVALAHGVTHERGRIKKPINEGGKLRDAVTRYRRRRVVTGHSLLELFPEHGRKHQLRRHLAAIGHGVLGDGRHGHPTANRHFAHRHGLDRTFLHCALLRVELDSGPVEIRAELAGDLAAVLASLEEDGART